MNITLYELTSEYRAVADKLSDMDLPAEVVADALESVSGALEEKAQNVAMFIRNLEATAEQIKQAEKAMSDRRKAIENRAAHIKEYLLSNMLRADIQKIECPFFKLSIRQNPGAVVIDDDNLLPADYLREIPARFEPDKTLIKQAIADGFDVPGAHLERGHRLEIK